MRLRLFPQVLQILSLSIILILAPVPTRAVIRTVELGLVSNFSEASSSSSNPFRDYFRDGVNLALQQSAPALAAHHLKIRLREFDYGANQLPTLQAADAANRSEVIAVLGYNWSANALLAAPIHQRAGLPMLTPSATANRLSTMGAFIHSAAFDDEFMGETLAKVASNRLHALTAAIVVAEDCAYCHDLADGFVREFNHSGGKVVIRAGVTESQSDFSKIVADIKSHPADVILVPNYEILSGRVIGELIEAGIHKPFLGGDGWGDVGDQFFKVLRGHTLQGFSVSHWHPSLPDARSVAFKSAFYEKYGKAPNDTAALSYDAMSLLIEALLKAPGYRRIDMERALQSIRNFSGVTGRFVYDAHGTPRKSIILLRVQGSHLEVVSRINPAGRSIRQDRTRTFRGGGS